MMFGCPLAIRFQRANNLFMKPPTGSSAAHPHDQEPGIDGLRLLRRYHEATIQHHERRAEVRFVIDAADGCMVLPAEPGMAAANELLVHLPDEVAQDLQLTVTPKVVDRPEGEEVVDRWHAYHSAAGTRPTSRVWLRCAIDGAKRPFATGDVYEPETIMRPNALRKSEYQLVKRVNQDRARLGRLCKWASRVDVADAICVGVDPFGFDVRARFGIVRIEFDLEAATSEQAARLIDAMLEKDGHA